MEISDKQLLAIVFAVGCIFYYYSCGKGAKDAKDKKPSQEIVDFSTNPLPHYEPIKSKPSYPVGPAAEAAAKELESWDQTDYETGNTPDCFNFKPKYNRPLDNSLEVSVGFGANVALKLMSEKTGKCIRYIYISAGSDFSIKNIPEGIYYTKIAYGKDWRQKIINGRCVGKFVESALYKKGESFDFNKIYKGKTTDENGDTYKQWSIPSYTLKLDVVTSNVSDQYQTGGISEADFND